MSLRTALSRLHNPFLPRWSDRSVLDFLQVMPLSARILNVGSGSTRLRPGIVNLDIAPLPNVDVVADARHMPFPDEYFDVVFCSAVLEHISEPWIVALEIERVLRTGGVLLLQAPFLEPVHDDHDYFRFTQRGLKALFPRFEELKSGVSASSNQVLADLLRVYPVFLCEGTVLELPAKFIMGWLAKPVQWLDYIVRRKPSMEKYARSVYFIGKKQP